MINLLLVWSLECGVWSFGREDRFYLKKTFNPDRIIKVASLQIYNCLPAVIVLVVACIIFFISMQSLYND